MFKNGSGLGSGFHKRDSTRPSPFDRLAESRRAKRWRDLCFFLTGTCFVLAIVLGVDPIVSGAPPRIATVLFLAGLGFLSFGLTFYFHMRYRNRE